MERCEDCGEYHVSNFWPEQHCKPRFYYQVPSYDEEWQKIRAIDFEDAAVKACEEEDQQGDYGIIQAGKLDEIIIKDKHGEIKKFFIEAESLPHYYAREIKSEISETKDNN